MTNPIIVALDGMTKNEALTLSISLQGKVWGFKVNDLLAECGVSIISELKNEKYIPHRIGSNPKDFLTPEKIIEVIDEYINK